MAGIPQTRFVRSGEAELAYQVFGAGEDLVLISGGLSHLEVAWELAELAAFLGRLASFRRVIVFDKRGTGMSDPVPGVPGLEEHVHDVIAVMDAAGSARACVMGWFDAAFVAAMPSRLAGEPGCTRGFHGVGRMKILVAGWDSGGGVEAVQTVVGRAVARGHQVRVLGTEGLRSRFESAGATFVRYKYAPDNDMGKPETDLVKDWQSRNPVTQWRRVRDRQLVGPARELCRDVAEELQRDPADVAVVDTMVPAAMFGAEVQEKGMSLL